MKFLSFLALLFAAALLLAGPLPGDFFAQGPANSKKIALTFDDGPGRHTEKFLDLLDKYHVKATFFMLGDQVQTRPKLAREVAARGHEIGNHTSSHINYLQRLKELKKEFASQGLSDKEAVSKAKEELLADMGKSRRLIEKTSGKKVRICRMPHGIDRPWIKEVAKEDGVILVNWSYGADWTKTPIEKLEKGYLAAIKPGAIFLFHDDGKNWTNSLRIAEVVIKTAKEKGFSVIPVGKLLHIN